MADKEQQVGLRKAEELEGPAPHHHCYPWHDPHTSHHQHPMTVSPVSLGKSADSGFVRWTGAHGVTGPNGGDLRHYDLGQKLPEIEALVRSYGFKTYYGGGRYGAPDLHHRNYDTGHLMIHDPSGGSHQDETYNRAWRQLHELSHALTQPEVNKTYGDGRRVGVLGRDLTLNDAHRALHWEWLAAHKQRELSEKIGVRIPDETFHQELNTIMGDAQHRLGTGAPQDPRGHGFTPHSHLVPLSTSMDAVRDEAQALGIKGLHDRLQKADVIYCQQGKNMADDTKEKTLSTDEALAFLKSEILRSETYQKIKAYEAAIQDLRKREVQKSLGYVPNPKSAAPTGSAGTVAPGKLHTKGEESPEETSSPERSSHEETPASLETAPLCKMCGGSHALGKSCVGKAELVDGKGKRKTTSEHPESVLPEDRKPEHVNKPGSGNETGSGGVIKKGRTLKSLHKAALNPTAKAEAPVAKPPSGKNMGTHVPTSKPAAPKLTPAAPAIKSDQGDLGGVQSPGSGETVAKAVDRMVVHGKPQLPKNPRKQRDYDVKVIREKDGDAVREQVEYTKKDELGKVGLPPTRDPGMKALASKHAYGAAMASGATTQGQSGPGSKEPALPTASEQATRAQNFAAAGTGAFTPTAPVVSGLETAKPKLPALASPRASGQAAGLKPAAKPGIFGRLLGKK